MLYDTQGRWGEAEKEKCPVNIFPAEPTDEAIYGEETLEPWVQGTPRHINQKGISSNAYPF